MKKKTISKDDLLRVRNDMIRDMEDEVLKYTGAKLKWVEAIGKAGIRYLDSFIAEVVEPTKDKIYTGFKDQDGNPIVAGQHFVVNGKNDIKDSLLAKHTQIEEVSYEVTIFEKEKVGSMLGDVGSYHDTLSEAIGKCQKNSGYRTSIEKHIYYKEVQCV